MGSPKLRKRPHKLRNSLLKRHSVRLRLRLIHHLKRRNILLRPRNNRLNLPSDRPWRRSVLLTRRNVPR